MTLAGITVARALTLGALARSQVVAGCNGLNRLICSVNVMEVPDIQDYVHPHQLLVTTGFPLKDDPEALLKLVPVLDGKGLAALAIKPLRYLPEISPLVVELGDRLAFPIIRLPADVSFSEVLNPVLSAILNEQAIRLQRAADIHSSMTALVLSGGGLPAIASTLAALIDLPVALLEPSMQVLASAAPPGGVSASELRVAVPGYPFKGDSPQELLRYETTCNGQACSQLLYPVTAAGQHYGSIAIWELGHPLQDDQRVALEHASTVVALEMAKEREIREVERRYRAAFLDDLLTGNYESPETLLLRARNLGYDLSGARMVLLLAMDDFDGFYLGLREKAEDAFRRLRERVVEVVRLAAQARDQSAIVVPRGETVVILSAPTSATRAKAESLRLASAIKQQLTAEVNTVTFSVGIGYCYDDVQLLAQSYSEAREALLTGRTVFGPDRITHYDDLGAYRLLARLEDRTEVERFCSETLGRLLEHDQQHGTALLHTLETFLRCNAHQGLTARELYVHYNTLRYRLKRIEELTGLHLNDPEERFNLQVALKVGRLGWSRLKKGGL